jgi:threonine/homoserine/homoserine lactone efflux protein
MLTIGLLVLSSIAVVIRAAGPNSDIAPAVLASALRQFVEPGVSLWWLTMGGVFLAFPNTTAGYVAAAIGNTLFWLAVAAILALLVGTTRRLKRRPQR